MLKSKICRDGRNLALCYHLLSTVLNGLVLTVGPCSIEHLHEVGLTTDQAAGSSESE